MPIRTRRDRLQTRGLAVSRAYHARVDRLDAVEQILIGQAEMKADNFGLELLY
jgi:hypothetical protein